MRSSSFWLRPYRIRCPEFGDYHDPVRAHLLNSYAEIPTNDLIRGMVAKVRLDIDQVTISLRPNGLQKLAKQYLDIRIPEGVLNLDPVIAFYKTSKAKRGAIVIESADLQKGLFDLPAHKLKKLVQGVVWRDEHFAGMTLKQIAARESCSEAYVSTAIFSSFDMPQMASLLKRLKFPDR